MFAAITQRWNAFKANWQEYQKLRRVAGRAWNKLDSLRAKITDFRNPDKTVSSKSCIRTKLIWLPHPMRFDGTCPEDHTLMQTEDYCPHFKALYADEAGCPCKEKSCSCYANNCEYVAAAAEYMDAVKKRREFWFSSKRDNKR